jgi:hypothetical protein
MSFFQNCILGFDTKKQEEQNALLVRWLVAMYRDIWMCITIQTLT